MSQASFGGGQGLWLFELSGAGVTASHHHAGGELPLGGGTVFDVKIGQVVGPEMGDVKKNMLTGVDSHRPGVEIIFVKIFNEI